MRATVAAVATGTVVPLDQLDDAVFASGKLGAGVGIVPETGDILSPVDGEVQVAMDAGHAYAIGGVLVHIGLNTVTLHGEGFERLVSKGDHVATGQPIARVDLDLLKQRGKDPTVVVLATETGAEVCATAHGRVEAGSHLFTLAEQQPADAAQIVAPVEGTAVALPEVPDAVFSTGRIGEGVGIRPRSGEVVAPADGVVQVAMDAGHAYGIRTATGAEILVHIGINAVTMRGAGFHRLVSKGQHVRAGAPLATVDLDAIAEAGLDPTVVVLVTNRAEFHAGSQRFGEVGLGEPLFQAAPN